MNYNSVTLVGNLTRDPELKFTAKGTAVAKVGMAINRTWMSEGGEKKQETTFVDIDMFGRTAENVGKFMRKGSTLLVQGRLKLDQWDDKQTGQKRSKLGVIAETVQFGSGGSRKKDSESAPAEATEAVAGDGQAESDDVPF